MCVSRDMVDDSDYLRAQLCAMFNVSATKISCRIDLLYNYESMNIINLEQRNACTMVSL